jgi:hypothetical protein
MFEAKKCLGESQWSKFEKIDVQKSLVTYEPGRKFTDKNNKLFYLIPESK